jgi:DNA helicase-2/ATP-dependent DNA helicase PcrA
MNQSLNTFLLEQLNAQQRKAVEPKEGSLLVIAGAGSGKTRIITSRIAHLMLNHGVTHREVIALTFTNKAAKEMQERIVSFLGSNKELPFVGTFHAYCLRLLKQNQELLEFPFFSVIDSDDQEKIIKGIIQRAHIHKQVTAKQLLAQISQLKNVAYTQHAQQAMFMQYPLLEDIFHAYEKEKKASKCLDFDDLLHHGLQLFNNPLFKARMQQTVRHILVDEYQDTNIVQHAFLKALTKNDANEFAIDSLCIVGDEDQSIYSWRGATIANMVHFKKDFPHTQIVKIEQNYRSVQPILDLANHVIKHNKERNPKELWSNKTGDNRIISVTCASEYQEGEAIAHFANIAKQTMKLNSCAVLYRTHFQSRAIEEALIKNAVPYKIFGGTQFYERKEIKDLLAYLRLIVNPFDRPSFFRIYNTPGRGLGDVFETQFYDLWSLQPFLSFKEIAQKMIDEEVVKGKKAIELQNFINAFNDISLTQKPSVILKKIIDETDYLLYLKDTNELEESQARLENVNEFMRAIVHFETEKTGNLATFLDEVALLQEQASKNDENNDALALMTLHAAKGLEFDTVILAGLEEGLLPSSRSLHDDSAIEEERRLFYVGITRARERLLLSKSRYRYSFGQMNDQSPSRFLREIPERMVFAHDLCYMQPYNVKQMFAQWLGAQPPVEATVMTFGSPAPARTKGTATAPTVKPVRSYATPKPNSFGPEKLGPVNSAPSASGWKINQPVKHATFGIGLVKKVEEQGNKVSLTVNFGTDMKKILASFVTKI